MPPASMGTAAAGVPALAVVVVHSVVADVRSRRFRISHPHEGGPAVAFERSDALERLQQGVLENVARLELRTKAAGPMRIRMKASSRVPQRA